MALIGSNVTAQTVDITTLSKLEQQQHRLGFCREIWMGKRDYAAEGQKLKSGKIGDMLELLKPLTQPVDDEWVYGKAINDTTKMLILGELIVDQQMLDECNSDMKAILAERYVPNFSYMQSNN